VKLEPTIAQAHFELGVALMVVQPARALKHLRHAGELNPELAGYVENVIANMPAPPGGARSDL